jgi:F-type H+-transporting ATPase subunit b
VEDIFAYLGLNAVDFLWHSLNFGLLLVALWWLFFRPITRMLQERERRVRISLARAEETDRLAEQAEAERRELLSSAHREAATIRARADEQARALLARARVEAHEESRRIVERAASFAPSRVEGLGRPAHQDQQELVGAAVAGKRG